MSITEGVNKLLTADLDVVFLPLYFHFYAEKNQKGAVEFAQQVAGQTALIQKKVAEQPLPINEYFKHMTFDERCRLVGVKEGDFAASVDVLKMILWQYTLPKLDYSVRLEYSNIVFQNTHQLAAYFESEAEGTIRKEMALPPDTVLFGPDSDLPFEVRSSIGRRKREILDIKTNSSRSVVSIRRTNNFGEDSIIIGHTVDEVYIKEVYNQTQRLFGIRVEEEIVYVEPPEATTPRADIPSGIDFSNFGVF